MTLLQQRAARTVFRLPGNRRWTSFGLIERSRVHGLVVDTARQQRADCHAEPPRRRVRHKETFCTGAHRSRPKRTEAREMKTRGKQNGPERNGIRAPLSGPRYRGSNPCLPASLRSPFGRASARSAGSRPTYSDTRAHPQAKAVAPKPAPESRSDEGWAKADSFRHELARVDATSSRKPNRNSTAATSANTRGKSQNVCHCWRAAGPPGSVTTRSNIWPPAKIPTNRPIP